MATKRDVFLVFVYTACVTCSFYPQCSGITIDPEVLLKLGLTQNTKSATSASLTGMASDTTKSASTIDGTKKQIRRSPGLSDEQCQEVFTVGYGYPVLFPLPSSSILATGSVLLKFSVMTSNDAHVLLSPNAFLSDNDPVYEVVIGGWGNTQSVIRRARQGDHKDTAQTKGIVSSTNMRNFWVRYERGLLTVGRNDSNDIRVILGWRDSSPLNIKYMSFASWDKGVGSWKYNCGVAVSTGPCVLEPRR